MKTPSTNRPKAAMAAMLLLLATASGCGVAMPTQPSIDATPAASRELATTASMDLNPLLIDEGSGSNNGGAGMGGPPPSVPSEGDVVVIAPPTGPGNSDWGHGRKKKKQH